MDRLCGWPSAVKMDLALVVQLKEPIDGKNLANAGELVAQHWMDETTVDVTCQHPLAVLRPYPSRILSTHHVPAGVQR